MENVGGHFRLVLKCPQVAGFEVPADSTYVIRLDDGGFLSQKIYIERFPIPVISSSAQLPFTILVDCILFCREYGSDTSLASSADYLESVIDGLVFDLYFPDEMKAAHCYITDCVASTIRPFEKPGSIASNTGYITGLCELFRNDKVINYGLLNSRNIKEVRIVTGEGV